MRIYIVILIITLVVNSYQDLPIHCLNSDVYGTWEFSLSQGKKVLSPIQNTCGHSIPDREDKSYLSLQYFEFKEDLKIKLELEREGIVNYEMKQFDNSIIKQLLSQQQYIHTLRMNNWTMIYDQGFQVNLQNGINFFVYNKYDKNPLDSTQYLSNCQETLLGWFQDKTNSLYGCIKGKKMSKSNNHIINNINEFHDINTFRFKAQKNYKQLKNLLFLGTKLKITAKFKDHNKMVMRLNKVQNKWQAKNNEFVQNKTVQILNKQMGRINKQQQIQEKILIEQIKDYDKLLNKQEKDKLLKDLPHFLNWEDKLDGAIQQGECGSCYAIAWASMINARLRIKEQSYDNYKFQTSIQQILDCNYYNQGCDGGYPLLVSKFGSEQILVNSSCLSYLAKDSQCSSICKDTQLGVKIQDYGYVGGRYGLQNVSARDIMQEIQMNGPVVVSFKPNFELMYYGEGIYHPLSPAQYLTTGEPKPEFQQIDHSVLCYGWGQTNDGQMYWMLQNSWGPNWGNKGNFKIRLGIDEMSIESSAEYANPVFVLLNNDLKATQSYQFMQNLKQ